MIKIQKFLADLPQNIPLSNNSKDILRHSRSQSRDRIRSNNRGEGRQKIVYDDNSSRSSSSRSRHRSRSPIHNIPHPPDDRRKYSMERSSRSVFKRLGSDPPAIPLRYSDSPSRWHNNNLNDSSDQMRIVVRNDIFQEGRSSCGPHQHHHPLTEEENKCEIIYAIKCLEQQNQDNCRHISGIRTTVKNYLREIAKLEAIVLQSSHEIEKLKSQLNLQNHH